MLVGGDQPRSVPSLLLAAEATERVELGTSIAVAFARNPMTTAMTANDLQAFSKGRFILGLGSQIKPHITKRFSMAWSHPAPRMREYVLAMRAIWDCWNNGTKLDFRGDFYTHTLMTPFFNPGPNPHGAPQVFLAGVGALMTEVAGEVCDGFLCHGFTTERYLREVTLPALERGGPRRARRWRASRSPALRSSSPAPTRSRWRRRPRGRAQQIAFYGSTPAYRGVLELHGWGGLQDELNRLSKQGKWVEMGELIDDEILNTFAVVGEPEQVAPELKRRYGDVIDRISFYAPYQADREPLAPGDRGTESGLIPVPIPFRRAISPQRGAGDARQFRLGQTEASCFAEVALAAQAALQLAGRRLRQRARLDEHDVLRREADGLADALGDRASGGGDVVGCASRRRRPRPPCRDPAPRTRSRCRRARRRSSRPRARRLRGTRCGRRR